MEEGNLGNNDRGDRTECNGISVIIGNRDWEKTARCRYIERGTMMRLQIYKDCVSVYCLHKSIRNRVPSSNLSIPYFMFVVPLHITYSSPGFVLGNILVPGCDYHSGQ